MITATIGVLALVITILAFIVKDKMSSAILHGVGMIAWTVMAYLLYNSAYPAGNPFLPIASMMIGITLVIVHTVYVVIPILAYFQPHRVSYEQEQTAIKQRIYKVTKRKEERW